MDLGAALSNLDALLHLSPNWDGYGALPISRTAANRARQFLVLLGPASVPVPYVVPRNDGLIQVEWHEGDVDIEVTVREGGFEFFVARGDAETDVGVVDAASFRGMMLTIRELLDDA